MYMNKLEKVEKLFKSCFKRKISITLGALVVFMMTGCGGGGGSSSSGSSPSYNVQESSKLEDVQGTTLQATKNEDGSYTLTDKNNPNTKVTGAVTKDGGFTITSDTKAADGSSLKGVTVKKELTKETGDRYTFTTKDGKVTKLTVLGEGQYKVERDGKEYSLTIKDGKVSGDINVKEILQDGYIAQYLIDGNLVKDGKITIEGKDGKKYVIEKSGDTYKVNGKTYEKQEDGSYKVIDAEEIQPSTPEGDKGDTPSTGEETEGENDDTITGGDTGTTPPNEDGSETEDKEPVNPEQKPEGPIYNKNGITVTKNEDGSYKVEKENTTYIVKEGEKTALATTIKDGNTYVYVVGQNGEKLDNKVMVNGTDVRYENNGTFIIDSGAYKGTKITKSSTGYDIDGKINSNGKETTVTFKLDSKGKVTGEINVAGQNYELAQSSSGLTGIKKDGAIYTGVSGYGVDGKEQTDYGTSYIYEKDGKKYHVLREKAPDNDKEKDGAENTATYVDISGIEKAISEYQTQSKSGETLSDKIVNKLYKGGKEIDKPKQTPGYITKDGNIGQYWNWDMPNFDTSTPKSLTGVDLTNVEKLVVKPTAGDAIGQGVFGGGAFAYNFGEIDVESKDGVAIGQYLSEHGNANSLMGSFNFGLINVKSNGKKTIYDWIKSDKKINGAGVYVEANGESYVTAVNYGKIVVDNSQVSKTDDKYYSVGMVANGKKAQAFNFGTIEVKGADNPVILQHGKLTTSSVFMTALNGGSIYNYGTFKSDASVNIDNSISTSTKAKYVSGDKITFSNDVAVLSEVGKGNEYVVEDFVTAKNGVEGLDKLKATGVYSVTTVEDTDADGNKVVDLKMTKTKKLEELTSGELARKIKEAGLDSYVYADGTGKYAEEINFLANENRVADLSKYFSTEYDNLNGAILETSRRMMDDSVELANADRSEFSGDFDRNFKGILASKDIPNLKLGVFKNYRKDANYGAGMDYDRDSVTVIVNQKINEKFSLNYGYENTKNKYDNGSKLDTHNFMLGANYVTPTNFYGMDYNFIGDIIVGRNKMEKNGKKGDNFYTYSVGMLNSLNKNLELSYFNKSNLVFGLRTVVFGHESITDKTVNNRIEDSLNLSNSFVAGLNLSKEFGITKNAKLKLTSNFGYEKELMKTSDWRDSVKMNDFGGTKFDMSTPMKDDKGGRAKALVKAEVEFNNGFSTGVYGSVDSLGYKEVGVSISYKF